MELIRVYLQFFAQLAGEAIQHGQVQRAKVRIEAKIDNTVSYSSKLFGEYVRKQQTDDKVIKENYFLFRLQHSYSYTHMRDRVNHLKDTAHLLLIRQLVVNAKAVPLGGVFNFVLENSKVELI